MLLLDTCTLLWLASDQDQLSSNAKKEIRENAGGLNVSAISAFEIALKHKKKKLILPSPFLSREWFEKVLEQHGINEIAVNSSIAIAAVELADHHRDPCDRIIISTAQFHNLIVLTPDPLFQSYSDVRIVW